MTRSFSIRYFPMLVAVALSVGFILGALFPVTYKAEAATVSLTVRVHPGAIGYLTCGGMVRHLDARTAPAAKPWTGPTTLRISCCGDPTHVGRMRTTPHSLPLLTSSSIPLHTAGRSTCNCGMRMASRKGMSGILTRIVARIITSTLSGTLTTRSKRSTWGSA